MYPIDLDNLPNNFTTLKNEPVFDPSKHLQLEKPLEIYDLSELGYQGEGLEESAASFAATSVFRVLSEEGAGYLYEVCKELEEFTTSNPRIARNVRGGVYRSKFLRDLCVSKDVTNFMSEIAQISLMPHTIPHQLGHLNYNPKTIGENVDKWHVDTLRFDYVMFVTDPTKNEGGEFQYFKGTKQEMAQLKAQGKPVPKERIISPQMPGAGYAVLQQGNMVVHQARGLSAPGERITMVNGYIPADPKVKDYTRYDQLCHADPKDVVTTEYSKHAAYQALRFLENYVLERPFENDPEGAADDLDQAAEILKIASAQIRDGKKNMEHFGE